MKTLLWNTGYTRNCDDTKNVIVGPYEGGLRALCVSKLVNWILVIILWR